MAEINTLAAISREVTLQSGSVLRVKPMSGMAMIAAVNQAIEAGVKMPDAVYDDMTLERWFADEEQRHLVKLAMKDRFENALKGLVRQILLASTPILCDVTGLTAEQAKELTPLDLLRVLKVVYELLDTKTLAETLMAFFSDLGGLGQQFTEMQTKFKAKNTEAAV